MFYTKRALVGVCEIWLATAACAFTFSYGNVLDITDVKNENGKLILPLTNKKYTNVKVLSKPLYGFLKMCETDCAYSATDIVWSVTDYRVAGARQNMLIVNISFAEDIQLTCLAFKNKKGISVKFPQVVEFKDANVKHQVREYIIKLAQENL